MCANQFLAWCDYTLKVFGEGASKFGGRLLECVEQEFYKDVPMIKVTLSLKVPKPNTVPTAKKLAIKTRRRKA
jgi:hypothetical protein